VNDLRGEDDLKKEGPRRKRKGGGGKDDLPLDRSLCKGENTEASGPTITEQKRKKGSIPRIAKDQEQLISLKKKRYKFERSERSRGDRT